MDTAQLLDIIRWLVVALVVIGAFLWIHIIIIQGLRDRLWRVIDAARPFAASIEGWHPASDDDFQAYVFAAADSALVDMVIEDEGHEPAFTYGELRRLAEEVASYDRRRR